MSTPERPLPEPARLLQRCRSASPPERTAAYDELGQALHRLLWPRVCGDPRLEHLAVDAAQEALVTVWRALEAGRGPDQPASFVSWAARIAVNKLVDMHRRLEPSGGARATRRVALSRQVRLDALGDDERHAPERLADPRVPDMDAAAAAAELQALVVEIGALDVVSQASKTVLLRGYLEDWADDELAEALGTSRGNVHVIRCRDLDRLRRHAPFMARLRALAGAGDASSGAAEASPIQERR